jgi:hypothetical protein
MPLPFVSTSVNRLYVRKTLHLTHPPPPPNSLYMYLYTKHQTNFLRAHESLESQLGNIFYHCILLFSLVPT